MTLNPLEITSGSDAPLEDVLPSRYRTSLAPAGYLEVEENGVRDWLVDPNELDCATLAFALRLAARTSRLHEAVGEPSVELDGRRWHVVDLFLSEIHLVAILQCGPEYVMFDQEAAQQQPWVRFAAEARGACSEKPWGSIPIAAAVMQLSVARTRLLEVWA